MEAIQSSARAFVALCRNGRVVAWGDPSGGGDLRPVAHELYVPLAVVPQHGWGLIFCGNFCEIIILNHDIWYQDGPQKKKFPRPRVNTLEMNFCIRVTSELIVWNLKFQDATHLESMQSITSGVLRYVYFFNLSLSSSFVFYHYHHNSLYYCDYKYDYYYYYSYAITITTIIIIIKWSNLSQSFALSEDRGHRGPLMEVMVAKILLEFGAAQATCRDDDDHLTSQLFKSKQETSSS